MSFWANKINGTPPPAPPIPSREMFTAFQPVNNTPQQQVPQQSIPQDYQPSVRLKQGGTCPGCGSSNYMQHGSYAVACGECGYHPRFEQAGYGERSLSADKGAVVAARQSGDHQTMKGSLAVLETGGGEHIK